MASKKDFVKFDKVDKSYDGKVLVVKDLQLDIAINKAYVIDIRKDVDFKAGHIKNAVNVGPTDVLTHVQGKDLTAYSKIAIVCYSGQTASWATSLLRLMGYNNAFTLKFGMSSWNESTNSWKTGISNLRASEFTTEATPKGAAGNLPTISTGVSSPEAILETRVKAVFAEGFDAAKISADVVFGSLSSYYIVNYWSEAHYNDPGHIPGAIQYSPKNDNAKSDLSYSQKLSTLPTDKPVVVYCYTGQTSAHMVAYLRVLGYDAKSLLYGANGMIYNLIDGKAEFAVWHDTYCMNYELVTD